MAKTSPETNRLVEFWCGKCGHEVRETEDRCEHCGHPTNLRSPLGCTAEPGRKQ